MKKKVLITIASIAGIGAISLAGIGVASAVSPNVSGNVGSSGIPRSVFRQDGLEAIAQVLNTSTSNVQSAIKSKTLHTLITNAGLNKQTFDQKLKAQLTSELESAGYSQNQITIALQHRTIIRLRHRLHN
jgi:hypothetical protein